MDGMLILNAEALDEIANLIERYCSLESDILKDSIWKVQSVGEEWDDEETFDNRVLSQLEYLRTNINSVIDEIQRTYPDYFKQRTNSIINRPSFRGGSSSISSTGGSSKDREPKKDLNSSLEKIFEKTNKDIKEKIFAYLMRIRFVDPNGRSSFYDPNGRSKRGLYKNIMAIDLNSPTFHQDLLRLTAQHMFFYLERKHQLSLIESFNNELNNNVAKHDEELNKFVDSIRSGKGLDFTYIKANDNDYKTGMAFFSRAFNEYVSGVDAETEIKKYFSNTYHRFVEILSNMDSLK